MKRMIEWKCPDEDLQVQQIEGWFNTLEILNVLRDNSED